MPSDARLGQTGHHFGVLIGQVLGFAPVGFHVIELGIGSVVLAEELPFALPYGEIGQVVVAVVGIAVRRAAKENGFGMFKWDPFEGGGTPTPRDLQDQIRKVEMVRDAVGSEYQIAIDAHNRFSVDGAIMAAQALEPFNILFFEAPTADDPEQLKQVANATDIPLATGELTCTRQEANALFDSGSLGVFQPEVGTNGGILETVRTADLAETYGLKIATHNWCGPVIMRAASHACSVIPNLLFQEYAGGHH